jgi:hypothetical protein
VGGGEAGDRIVGGERLERALAGGVDGERVELGQGAGSASLAAFGQTQRMAPERTAAAGALAADLRHRLDGSALDRGLSLRPTVLSETA